MWGRNEWFPSEEEQKSHFKGMMRYDFGEMYSESTAVDIFDAPETSGIGTSMKRSVK